MNERLIIWLCNSIDWDSSTCVIQCQTKIIGFPLWTGPKYYISFNFALNLHFHPMHTHSHWSTPILWSQEQDRLLLIHGMKLIMLMRLNIVELFALLSKIFKPYCVWVWVGGLFWTHSTWRHCQWQTQSFQREMKRILQRSCWKPGVFVFVLVFVFVWWAKAAKMNLTHIQISSMLVLLMKKLWFNLLISWDIVWSNVYHQCSEWTLYHPKMVRMLLYNGWWLMVVVVVYWFQINWSFTMMWTTKNVSCNLNNWLCWISPQNARECLLWYDFLFFFFFHLMIWMNSNGLIFNIVLQTGAWWRWTNSYLH